MMPFCTQHHGNRCGESALTGATIRAGECCACGHVWLCSVYVPVQAGPARTDRDGCIMYIHVQQVVTFARCICIYLLVCIIHALFFVSRWIPF